MNITIEHEGDRVIIRIPAQLVVSNRQELKQHLLEELERGARRFRIDFGQTAYVDTAGLGALVAAAKEVRQSAGELRLANLNDDLRTLFQLTRLDSLFGFDEDDGLAGRPAPLPPRQPPPKHGEADPD